MFDPTSVPRLVVTKAGERAARLTFWLTAVPHRFVIRLTGGCGAMDATDAEGLYELFNQALVGFDGALLYGGTRMLLKADPKVIVPGITEIPSRLRPLSPHMRTLGVIPRTDDLSLCDHGLIISREEGKPYFTVIHPDQDSALVVQLNADDPAAWDAEYRECLAIISDLHDAEFNSVLICYNGGSVSRREVLATAERGWPVILVRDSGRETDTLAADRNWLASHPDVVVAEKNAASLRRCLAELGAVPQERLTLVKARSA